MLGALIAVGTKARVSFVMGIPARVNEFETSVHGI
jgi:hypothetical protein